MVILCAFLDILGYVKLPYMLVVSISDAMA